MIDLHDICIPVLVRYLDNLDGILGEAELFVQESGTDEAGLLRQALREDMLPLKWQLKATIGFALRTVSPLLAIPLAIPDGPIDSIAAIRSLGKESRALLAVLPREALAGPRVLVSEQAGQAVIELPALDFVTQYALPNFFFHFATAYALLRRAGCPVGKSDFDGFHRYAAGVDLARDLAAKP